MYINSVAAAIQRCCAKVNVPNIAENDALGHNAAAAIAAKATFA